MKQIRFILWLAFLLVGCNNSSEIDIDKFKENLDSLLTEDFNKNIQTIDSLLNAKSYNDEQQGLLYYKQGTQLNQLQDDSKARSVYTTALRHFKDSNSELLIAKTYYALGATNLSLANKDLALEQLLLALEKSKELNNIDLESSVYSSLAHFHYLYEDYEASLFFAKKTLDIEIKKKDSVNISREYNNLAIIYKNLNDFTNALQYNEKSLEISVLKKDDIGISKSYTNLGVLYEKLNHNEDAISYYKQAIEINKKKKVLNTIPTKNLGLLYLNNGDYLLAKQYLLKALEIEKKPRYIKEMYNSLLKIALQTKDYDNALAYQKKVDSIDNAQLRFDNEKLKLIENKYKLSAKNVELAQQKQTNTKNRIIFISCLALAFLTSIVLFLKNQNAKLQLAKDKIRLEQKVLRSQMNPHFIFNALSAIQNSLLDNDALKSASYLSKFAKLIRQNFDFIDHKTILLSEEIDALKNYLDTQKMRFNNKFDYEIQLDDALNPNKVEIPPLLIQPFIENAIEHGFKNKKEKGLIIVSMTLENDKISYRVVDNGKGFDTLKKDNKTHAIDVFKKRLKLIGNNDEKSFKIKTSSNGTIINFSLSI